jgi:Protein of unknown function (DUF2846)
MKKKISIPFVFICFMFVLSCSTSLKLATESESDEAKNLSPNENESVVYFFQSSSYLLKPGALSSIKIDNKYIGSISERSFIVQKLTPGIHSIEIVGQHNTDRKKNFEAGKVYYYECISATGMPQENVSLNLLKDSKGKRKLTSCSLSLE